MPPQAIELHPLVVTADQAEQWQELCEYLESGFPNEEIEADLAGVDLTQFCQWAVHGLTNSNMNDLKIWILEVDLYVNSLRSDLEFYRIQDATLSQELTSNEP